MKNVLITGGAGFIGSHIVDALLERKDVGLVRVIDDLSTGNLDNLSHIQNNPKFEFVKGDIRAIIDCNNVLGNIHLVCHQAALGSVPRSIKDPLTTNDVNITGFLNMLKASVDAKVERFIFAASSSTYGDSKELPKQEDVIGNPLSPYAVTKYVNELYAQVFSSTYDLPYIGLRYFNVFGPRQSPKGAYAAVIPLFIDAILKGESPKIHGDGEQSRDFTYVANAVHANIKALFNQKPESLNEIYNIACGERITINDLFNGLCYAANTDIKPKYIDSRIGDVRHSLADISKAQNLMGYNPEYKVKLGLQKTLEFFMN